MITPPPRRRIVDVTLYNGEPVLGLRLAYLAPYVDGFVIVEARETHAGAEKLPGGGLYSDRAEVRELLALYAPRVRVVVLDRFPPMPPDWPAKQAAPYMAPDAYSAWFREKYQRDFIAAELLAALPASASAPAPPTVYTICDVDEIPHANVLRAIRDAPANALPTAPFHLGMRMYYYSFDWLKQQPWDQAFALSHDALAALAAAGQTLSDVRTGRVPSAGVVANAGWHLSYFMTRDDLRRKLASFAHRECDRPECQTDAHLDACFADGRDLFGRDATDPAERLQKTAPGEAAREMGAAAAEFQAFLTTLQRRHPQNPA